MDSILTRIVDCKRREVEAKIKAGAYDRLPAQQRRPLSFSKALTDSPTGIIAEFKRRSPSKGEIHPMAMVDRVVAGYAAAGASCCSILTDTPFFGGSLADFAVARSVAPSTPLLRKEFIVNSVQITEAAAYGADAILLIASVLPADLILEFTRHAHSLGLEVLLELHGAAELDSMNDEVDMVGINNRNLNTFDTDVARSSSMAAALPSGMVKVAESGISSIGQVMKLRDEGYRGFLIGETFMRHDDPALALKQFINDTL